MVVEAMEKRYEQDLQNGTVPRQKKKQREINL